jgi:hypothetical protein
VVGKTRHLGASVAMSNYSLFFDDSGHPDGQPFVVTAGFVATEENWLAFEPVWKEALVRHGISGPFHMADFFFAKRSVKERSPVLRDLAAIIVNHAHAAFTGAVEMAAYRKVNAEYALQEYLGAPYALAARAMALGINQWVQHKLGPSDHLALFAEDGTKHRGDLAEVFKRDGLPEPRTVPKSVTAVQPADMLAWEVFTALRTKKPYRRLKRLVDDHLDFGGTLRESDLRDTCTQVGVPLRSALPPTAQISFHTSKKRLRKKTI